MDASESGHVTNHHANDVDDCREAIQPEPVTRYTIQPGLERIKSIYEQTGHEMPEGNAFIDHVRNLGEKLQVPKGNEGLGGWVSALETRAKELQQQQQQQGVDAVSLTHQPRDSPSNSTVETPGEESVDEAYQLEESVDETYQLDPAYQMREWSPDPSAHWQPLPGQKGKYKAHENQKEFQYFTRTVKMEDVRKTMEDPEAAQAEGLNLILDTEPHLSKVNVCPLPVRYRYNRSGHEYEMSCGHISTQGLCEKNNDRKTVLINDDCAVLGVYAGVKDPEAAEHCRQWMQQNLLRLVKNTWCVPACGPCCLRMVRRRGTLSPVLLPEESQCIRQISSCIREAFVVTDRQFLSTSTKPRSGSSAVVTVIINGVIIVGNLGNSRAVMCRGNQPMPLSFDHNCERQDEVQRIKTAGKGLCGVRNGHVVVNNAKQKIHNIALAETSYPITRAIGAAAVKVPPNYDFRDEKAPQVVTSEPEISITELVPEDRFILIASSGVWNVMDSHEAIQYCYNSLRVNGDPQTTAQDLVGYVVEKLKSKDSITVVLLVPQRRHLGFTHDLMQASLYQCNHEESHASPASVSTALGNLNEDEDEDEDEDWDQPPPVEFQRRS